MVEQFQVVLLFYILAIFQVYILMGGCVGMYITTIDPSQPQI